MPWFTGALLFANVVLIGLLLLSWRGWGERPAGSQQPPTEGLQAAPPPGGHARAEMERLEARLAQRLRRQHSRLAADLESRFEELAARSARTGASEEFPESEDSERPTDEVPPEEDPSTEPELVLDPEVGKERQFGSMTMEPERRAEAEQIFDAYWPRFVDIQLSKSPDVAQRRVELWKEYCAVLLPLLRQEEARQLGCAASTIIRPEPGPKHPIGREFVRVPHDDAPEVSAGATGR